MTPLKRISAWARRNTRRSLTTSAWPICESLCLSKSESFDLVICNAVIQHLSPEDIESTTIPELTRVLAPGGVLQLMFKVGSGVASISDWAYGDGGEERVFQLYKEGHLLSLLEDQGCSIVEPESPNSLGGLLYFTDPKPMRYCIFWVRKD